MARKTIKNKTYSINVSKIISMGKVSKVAVNKFINTTLTNMARSGQGSALIDPFIKQAKSVQKILNKGNKKLSTRQINKVVTLLDYNKGERVLKGGNVSISFTKMKYTKATKFNPQAPVTKQTLNKLKNMGISTRDRKNILKRVEGFDKSSPKNIYELELVVSSDSEIYDIILGMGGGDFKTALKEYPEDVKRLCNDYLGIDIDDWYLE